jgi:uncharacterized membrane protein
VFLYGSSTEGNGATLLKEVVCVMGDLRPFRFSCTLVVLAAIALALIYLRPSFAEEKAKEEKENRPARAMAIYPEYPGVVVPKGEEVRMDLIVANGGRSDEDVLLEVTSIPKGWDARVKTYNFTITGVHVPDGDKKTVTFLAEPDKSVEPGTYVFKLRGKTRDGALESESEITVQVKAKEEEKKQEDIIITTSYPVLRGPSDVNFEFSIEVQNKMDKDSIFNLAAKGPADWEINFKPAYESKYISSLRLKSGQSQSVAMEVKPPRFAKSGEYPIEVTVSSGERKAEAKLMVMLTGTFNLDAGTITGLLSLTAQQGKPAIISLYVKNSGSATQHDISFLSFKPENWKVEFDPERLDTIEPGDIKQVEVKITPAEQALVGDYSVGLNVKGEKSAKDVELRVTVRASTVWGWVGIAIILAVILGLCVLFVTLGRR